MNLLIHPSIPTFIRSSIYTFMCLLFHPFTHPSIYLWINWFIHPFIHPFTYPSVLSKVHNLFGFKKGRSLPWNREIVWKWNGWRSVWICRKKATHWDLRSKITGRSDEWWIVSDIKNSDWKSQGIVPGIKKQVSLFPSPSLSLSLSYDHKNIFYSF